MFNTFLLLMQIPPTPTPLGPGTEYFSIPEEYSLWASTDAAIHTWNWIGLGQLVAQAFILIGIVLTGLALFNWFVNQFTLDKQP